MDIHHIGYYNHMANYVGEVYIQYIRQYMYKKRADSIENA